MTPLSHQLKLLAKHVDSIPKKKVTIIDRQNRTREEQIEKAYATLLKFAGAESTVGDMAEAMDRPRGTVAKYLKALKDQKRVKLVGKGNNVKWKATDA